MNRTVTKSFLLALILMLFASGCAAERVVVYRDHYPSHGYYYHCPEPAGYWEYYYDCWGKLHYRYIMR